MSPIQPFNFESLLRPSIRELKPYRSARDDFKSGILLDANENPYSPGVEQASGLNRYPDPHCDALRARLSELKGISPEQIFAGNGSDEAIDLLIRMFCEPGRDRIIITPPTYGMYRVSADINGVACIECPLNPDFTLNPERILDAAPGAKLIFLCSPNNPTSNRISTDAIEQILSKSGCLVVVDEAYIDFSEEKSLLPLIDRYPNLVVLQTLSKAWGLAGIRLGMAFGAVGLISYMMRVKPPYNVNALTQQTALDALSSEGKFREHLTLILRERERVSEALKKMRIVKHVHPSDANFLLVNVENALDLYHGLARKGVIVRYRGDQLHCNNCLRITIGTPAENDALLLAMREVSEIKASNSKPTIS